MMLNTVMPTTVKRSDPRRSLSQRVLLGLLVAMVSLFQLAAEENCLAEIRFVHDSREVQLGAQGTETDFTVIVTGLHRKDLPLDVEMVRDGELFPLIALPKGYTSQEEPIYSFSTSAPRAGFVYRFSVENDAGEVVTSEYYWRLQHCQDRPGALHKEEIASNGEELTVGELAKRAQDLEEQLLRQTLAEKRLRALSTLLRRGS
ncbi:hypothetical protein MRY87_08965 [bacterium]|nr:hypothetical protein [bacterium]